MNVLRKRLNGQTIDKNTIGMTISTLRGLFLRPNSTENEFPIKIIQYKRNTVTPFEYKDFVFVLKLFSMRLTQ